MSDTPIVSYDPTRDNVLAHELVNETVMKEFTVIPMSFGTVFRSEGDVTELLRSTYQAFSDVLAKMEDKIEFGVKVLWDRERVISNVAGRYVAAFLVDRAQEQAFDERVKETSRKYEGVLSFKYSGPWPPYNFVNIKLKLERAD